MDGKFVKSLGVKLDIVQSVKQNNLFCDVHLMVSKPLEDGYISKESMESDNRYNLLQITEKGREVITKSNEIFGGFIIGKLIDSAIIGVLCFFGMSILKMPYTVLISVIIGVTNVIPFFGPYIGAIPSTILIMLQNPMQGLYFVLFILVLQQFDGNILGPKILGNSTGLSAFWVIVAILLGGGLFGFIGMIMGVPTFAVIYYVVELFINSRLEKKNLPSDTQSYDPKSYVDDKGNYVNGK